MSLPLLEKAKDQSVNFVFTTKYAGAPPAGSQCRVGSRSEAGRIP